MKKNPSSEVLDSCKKVAEYIYDDDSEWESFDDFVNGDGNDPKGHVLYHAAVVLGKVKSLGLG